MILIFNGPPFSGKDFSCDILENDFGFVQKRFKDVLFKKTIEYYNVEEKWFMDGYNREKKEINEKSLDGKSRRNALIHVSENIIKPKYGNGFFGIETAKELITIDKTKPICISDGGFYSEVSELINIIGNKRKVAFVRLYRDGCDFSKDSRKYIRNNVVKEYVIGFRSNLHAFENQFDNAGILDNECYTIHNNQNDVTKLKSILSDIIKEIYNK